MKDTSAFALQQLDRLQGFFPRVEGKATFLFAANVGMLAAIGLGYPIKEPFSWVGGVGFAATALLCGSLLDVYRTIFPRLKYPEKIGVVFFGHIAQTSAEYYTARIQTMSDAELLEDIGSQIVINSKYLDVKFKAMERAFRLSWAALLPWVLFIAMVANTTGSLPLNR